MYTSLHFAIDFAAFQWLQQSAKFSRHVNKAFPLWLISNVWNLTSWVHIQSEGERSETLYDYSPMACWIIWIIALEMEIRSGFRVHIPIAFLGGGIGFHYSMDVAIARVWKQGFTTWQWTAIGAATLFIAFMASVVRQVKLRRLTWGVALIVWSLTSGYLILIDQWRDPFIRDVLANLACLCQGMVYAWLYSAWPHHFMPVHVGTTTMQGDFTDVHFSLSPTVEDELDMQNPPTEVEHFQSDDRMSERLRNGKHKTRKLAPACRNEETAKQPQNTVSMQSRSTTPPGDSTRDDASDSFETIVTMDTATNTSQSVKQDH